MQEIKSTLIRAAISRVEPGHLVTIVADKKDELPSNYLIGISAQDAERIGEILKKNGFEIESFGVKKADFFEHI